MAEPVRPQADRLPWLGEVPRIGPAELPAKPRRSRSIPWLPFLLGAAFAGVGVGAYWLGTRQDPQTASTEQAPPVALPLDQSIDELPPPPAADEPIQTNAVEPAPTGSTAPSRQAERRLAPRPQASGPRPGTNTEAAEQPSAATPSITPVQPEVRGRIVQTGAYPSRALAEQSWQQMVKRWPYLATKPRLIAPLEVRSTDGRATRMYRVQLATASQAQSVVICQQLERARQSCVVVY